MSKLTYIKKDIFSAPKNSILVHACNARGSWGAGIALAFRERYPDAYTVYQQHCKVNGSAIVGTCLLIPGEHHDIACLFTSKAYGRQKDNPEQILAATRTAMGDLMRQNTNGKKIHACQINSGKFGVPWVDTERILEELNVEMTIYDPVVPTT
ncbi:ADP-ribose 1''-phosphate phosphatase [Guyanagaster necrorhizus]|uniref:ADP-ribose 1''-phosphate phosphatase n=1 Tax=Guyanagaster necrorhizus TaxID=856835 RepID=A0A9P8AQR3_9AGAR|nr:ADP-ribose 1''-phosphate phosphatase [Guyanagaster necrorhizus MCA 3950]KAG7444141.1 ADP-ribose 1''-phosphate phosphatase [Guyanagaster necrorhizus MCA 3950]